MSDVLDAVTAFAAREPSDEELLLRYRSSGHIESFEELVHRYEAPIYNYLLRYLRNAELAEEVFQATFLRVHEKADTFMADRNIKPWLYSIATHQAIDAVRREGRHRAVSLNEEKVTDEADVVALINLLESRVPSPLEQLEARERREWTQQAVDQLPEPLRVVVLLIYFQGLKYREVAEALNIPVGTVKSRVHKALVRLNAAWRRDHTQGADGSWS